MKVQITGALNPYYIQTLCMLFFPGEKFSESEEEAPDTIFARITLREDVSAVTAEAVLSCGSKYCRREWTETWNPSVGEPERIRKIAAGRAFLLAGKDFTGVTPPWGIMTGVRPAKLVSEYLAAGKTPAEAAALLQGEYFVSPDKASLAVDVACAEARLISPEKRKECSLYIAIPFCPTRCAYCSFVSYTSPNLLKQIPAYLDVLVRDIDRTCALIHALGLHISTVYIGGGTPTILEAGQLECLLSHIAAHVPSCEEFTLEAGRPDTITKEKLTVARQYGVNRISVNTQTLNEQVLARIGRKHTAAQFFAAFDTARQVGIPAINIDLIAGLPGDTAASFRATLDQILPLQAEDVTVHTFCVKKSAALVTEGVFDSEGTEAMESVRYAQSALCGAGYVPYYMYRQKNTVGNLENVGYAKPGYEGLYNVYMMEEVHSIFSCGASAVTKFVSLPDAEGTVQIERLFQPKYPYEYLREYETGTYARFATLEKTARKFYEKQ